MMTYIDELLKEHCPNGVEWKELGEVCEFIRGNGLQKKDFVEKGYPVIHYGQIYTYYGRYADTTKSYVNEETFIKLKKANQGDLVVATTSENIEDVGKALVWLGKDELGIGGHSCILKTDVDTKYLSYVFETVHFQKQKEKLVVGTKVIELYPKNLAKIVVPVPPLIVQKEIVKILDKFSEYVTELTAELTLRQKQYSFYRDKLLSFEGEVYEVEWKTLEEICDVRDGTHDSPTKQNYGNYLITSKNVKQGSVTFENAYYISPEDFEAINKRSKVDVDDLLFTMIGTVGEVAHVVEEPDYAIKNVGLIKTSNRVLSRYLFHYLQSSNAKQYIEENKSKGSQVFLALGKIRKFPIPYVSHNIQSRIVQVLDNFDTVCNDLNIGLPKEIEQRQKQYEFIRDKLLTFTAEGVYPDSGQWTVDSGMGTI